MTFNAQKFYFFFDFFSPDGFLYSETGPLILLFYFCFPCPFLSVLLLGILPQRLPSCCFSFILSFSVTRSSLDLWVSFLLSTCSIGVSEILVIISLMSSTPFTNSVSPKLIFFPLPSY